MYEEADKIPRLQLELYEYHNEKSEKSDNILETREIIDHTEGEYYQIDELVSKSTT